MESHREAAKSLFPFFCWKPAGDLAASRSPHPKEPAQTPTTTEEAPKPKQSGGGGGETAAGMELSAGS